LKKIDANSTDDLLLSNMEKFNVLLKNHLEAAYTNGTKVNDYFKELILSKEWFNIKNL